MPGRSQITDATLMALYEHTDKLKDEAFTLLHLMETSDALTPDLETDASLRLKQIQVELMKMRPLHRDMMEAVRKTKEETAKARDEVDGLHLQKQNLEYEQNHLKTEIAACENFDHKYQHLDLIPVEEYLAQYPEHAELDPHELMIARINDEHQHRQALEEQRQGLLKRKQALIADNNRRKDDLANLDKSVEKFLEGAEPIKKIFHKAY
ncbi:hypothetical protein K402DRAFT_384746 [Aulographum hederae CBS 113979]|uniref:Fms interacting protein n=1 Tax=Aulographum hederae CBS 113979 TaxID=1176131 RepID=A0A6G1GN18_9PEZI|nr:hypothetical protein K402DRAFT_384746 [Aulographum hederae CBS 113979]